MAAAERTENTYRVTWTGSEELADARHTITVRDFRGEPLLSADVPAASARLRVRELRRGGRASAMGRRRARHRGVAGVYDDGYLYAFDLDLSKLVAAERRRRLDAVGIDYDDTALDAAARADSTAVARAADSAVAVPGPSRTPALNQQTAPSSGSVPSGGNIPSVADSTDGLPALPPPPNSVEAVRAALGLDTRMLLNRVASVEVCIVCPITGEVNCAAIPVDAVEEAPTEDCDLSGEIVAEVGGTRATELDLRWRLRGRLRGDSIKVTYVALDEDGLDVGTPTAVHLRKDARALTLRDLREDTDYRITVCWHCAVPTGDERPVVRRRCASPLRVRTAAFVCLDSLALLELVDVTGLPADRVDVDFAELATVADASRLTVALVDAASRAPAARLDSAALSEERTQRRYLGLPSGSEQAVRICYACPPGATAPVRPPPFDSNSVASLLADSVARGTTDTYAGNGQRIDPQTVAAAPIALSPTGESDGLASGDTSGVAALRGAGVLPPPPGNTPDAVAERHCATIPVRVPTCAEFDLAFETTAVAFDGAWLRWRYAGEDTVTLEVKPINRTDADGAEVQFRTGETALRTVRAHAGNGLTRDGEFAVFALDSLVELTEYAVKVCGGCADELKCGWIELWTPDVSCKLGRVEAYAYSCDPGYEFAPAVFGAERAPRLNPGDTIWAGDFLVQVVEATEVAAPTGAGSLGDGGERGGAGADGMAAETPDAGTRTGTTTTAGRADDPGPGEGPFFRGYGFVRLPMLDDALVQLEFDAIEVSKTCRMVSGDMRMVSPVYTPGDLLDGFGGGAGGGAPGDATEHADWLDGMRGAMGGYPGPGGPAWDDWLNGLRGGQAAYADLPFYSEDVARAIQDAIDCLNAVESVYAEELYDLREAERDEAIAALDPEREAYFAAEAAVCAAKLRAALDAAAQYEGLLYAAPYAVDFRTGTLARGRGSAPDQAAADGIDRQPAAAIAGGYTARAIAGRDYRVGWVSTAGGKPIDVTGFRASGYGDGGEAGAGYASRVATPEGAGAAIAPGAKVLDAEAGLVAGWRATDGTPIEGAGLDEAAVEITGSLSARQVGGARALKRRTEATVRVAVVNPDTGRMITVTDETGVAVADSVDPRVAAPPVVFAGELSLVDYATTQQRTLHLVGLDSVTLAAGGSSLTPDELERRLNAIYAGAQVEWTIVIDPALPTAELRELDSEFTGRFADTGSGLASAYTAEMRVVRRAQKQSDAGVEKQDLYLVLAPALGGDRLGFMPRGKRFGFVDVGRHGGDGEALVRTIAHELGHGAFRLEHLDVRYAADGYTGGATDNLMESANGGVHLGKWQWDNCHDPESNVALFDDDEEGEYVYVSGAFLAEAIAPYAVDGRLAVMSPVGEPVALDVSRITDLMFSSGGERWMRSGETINEFLPVGSLVGFAYGPDTGAEAGEVDQVAEAGIYVACSDGEYGIQEGIADLRSVSSFKCGGAKLAPGTPKTGAEALLARVSHDADGKPGLVLATRNVNEGPPLDPKSFDAYLDNFFSVDAQGVYTALGEFSPLARADGAAISNEFYHELYLDFVANHREYADYRRLSSFYIGGSALVFQNFEPLASACGLSTGPAELLEAYAKALTTLQTGGGHYTRRPIQLKPLAVGGYAPLRNQVREQVMPGLFARRRAGGDATLNEAEIARFFDLIALAVDRSAVISLAQGSIDELGGVSGSSDFDLDDALEVLREANVNLTDCEWDNLTVPYPQLERLVDDYLGGNNAWTYLRENDNESAMLRLLGRVKPAESHAFLTHLSETKLPDGEYAWKELIDRIDKDWIALGADNGQALVNQLIRLSSEAYAQERGGPVDAQGLNRYLARPLGVTLTDEDIAFGERKVIPYNYTKLLARLGYDLAISLEDDLDALARDWTAQPLDSWFSYQSTEVTVRRDGRFDIRYDVEQAPLTTRLTVPAAREGLHPFEPIIVDPSSTYRSAAPFVDELRIVPACVLYQLENTAAAETVTDAVVTTLDVVSLATPVGWAAKVGRVGQLLHYADKASSVLSLTASAFDAGQPESAAVKEVVDWLNVSSAALGVASLTHSGGSWIKATYEVDDLKKAVRLADADPGTARAVAEVELLAARTEALSETAKAYIREKPAVLEATRELLVASVNRLGDAGAGGTAVRAAVVRALGSIESAVDARGLLVSVVGLSKAQVDEIARVLGDDEMLLAFARSLEGGSNELKAWYRIANGDDLRDKVQAWEIVSEVGIATSLRHDPVVIGKVRDYIISNPAGREELILALKSESNPSNWLDRLAWRLDIIQKYGNDIDDFQPQGMSVTESAFEFTSSTMYGVVIRAIPTPRRPV